MTRKQQLQEKKIKKLEAKKKKNIILNKYIDLITIELENEFLNTVNEANIFNEQIMKNILELSKAKSIISKVLKDESYEQDYELIKTTIETIENQNQEMQHFVSCSDIHNNKLLQFIPNITNKVQQILRQAEDELSNEPNRFYITSLILNNGARLTKKYNFILTDISNEINSYVDEYEKARIDFVDFVENCKDKINYHIEKIEEKYKEDEQEEINIKYKERLRISYNDMENFLKEKGYYMERQNSTTHAIWKNEKGISIPLPNKSGTLPQGTVSSILKQIDSNRQELANYLYL